MKAISIPGVVYVIITQPTVSAGKENFRAISGKTGRCIVTPITASNVILKKQYFIL